MPGEQCGGIVEQYEPENICSVEGSWELVSSLAVVEHEEVGEDEEGPEAKVVKSDSHTDVDIHCDVVVTPGKW